MKEQIRKILENHQGRENAITRRELRQKLNLSDRQDRMLRLMIAELRHEGFPILFSTGDNAGYYLPNSLSEVEEGKREWRAKIIDECITLASLKKYGARFVQREEQLILIK